MEQINLVMMGLRGSLLLMVQEYESHPQGDPVRNVLVRYLGTKWSKKRFLAATWLIWLMLSLQMLKKSWFKMKCALTLQVVIPKPVESPVRGRTPT